MVDLAVSSGGLQGNGLRDSNETCLGVSAYSAVGLLSVYLVGYLEIIYYLAAPGPLLLVEICLEDSVVIITIIIKEPYAWASKLSLKPKHYKAN